MKPRAGDKTVHLLFDIGLIGKALDGVLEVVGGVVLLFVTPEQINGVLRALTQHELSADRHDAFTRLLQYSVQPLSSSTKGFAAFFLLSHGLIKIGLVVALRRRRAWAYPIAIVAFGLFLGYQVYRYTHTGSVWLLALSVLDLFVIALTWLEYQRLLRSQELG